MREARRAENFLALVCTSDRASSMVGDLIELGADRNPVWFWLQLIRIWLSLLASELRTAPLELLRAAAKAIWVGTLGALAAFLGLSFILILVLGIQGTSAFDWAVTGSLYLLPFIAGVWAAQSAPGREFVAGVVTAVVLFALYWGLGICLSWQLGPQARLMWTFGKWMLPVILMQMALASRRNALRSRSGREI